MQIKVEKAISNELKGMLEEHGVPIREKLRLRLSPDDIFQWLIVGGGLISIAQAIIEYKKIYQNKRRISINVKQEVIDIETQSIDELKDLLEEAKTIFIEMNKTENG